MTTSTSYLPKRQVSLGPKVAVPLDRAKLAQELEEVGTIEEGTPNTRFTEWTRSLGPSSLISQ